MPLTLIKRAVKGSALNATEHDNNLAAVETEVNGLETRTITAGTGLTGGGNLSANRTVALSAGSIASLARADEVPAVQASVGTLETRTITAGTGLTGGGDLSASRTVALSSASILSLLKADSAVQPPALDLYAPLAAPVFTGNPVAPTQATDDNSTRLASTAYVTNKVATKANLVDGALAVGEIPQVVSISDPTGIPGAFAIRNIVGISAADFAAINPDTYPTTTFLVTD